MTSTQDTIRRIASTYRSCSSYQDEGSAKIVDEDGTIVSNCRFRTIMARPKLLRFEFQERLWPDEPINLLCCGAEKIECNAFECNSTLTFRQAIASMHGISKGAISLISTLMFDSLRNFLKSSILDLQFTEVAHGHYESVPVVILTTQLGEKLICGEEDNLVRYAKMQISVDSTRYVDYEISCPTIDQSVSPDIFQM